MTVTAFEGLQLITIYRRIEILCTCCPLERDHTRTHIHTHTCTHACLYIPYTIRHSIALLQLATTTACHNRKSTAQTMIVLAAHWWATNINWGCPIPYQLASISIQGLIISNLSKGLRYLSYSYHTLNTRQSFLLTSGFVNQIKPIGSEQLFKCKHVVTISKPFVSHNE